MNIAQPLNPPRCLNRRRVWGRCLRCEEPGMVRPTTSLCFGCDVETCGIQPVHLRAAGDDHGGEVLVLACCALCAAYAWISAGTELCLPCEVVLDSLHMPNEDFGRNKARPTERNPDHMTATVAVGTEDQSRLRERHQVLVDLDGCLIDMAPFAAELDDEPDRWVRFFSHTAHAKPVDEGVELIDALARLRCRYSVSTTRPHGVRNGKVWMPQLPVVQSWAKAHLPATPRWIYMRAAAQTTTTPVDVKRGHFLASAEPPMSGKRSISGILCVDDEFEVVDGLVDHGIPALHLTDLVGVSGSDLEDLLIYGAVQAERVHREHAEQRKLAGV